MRSLTIKPSKSASACHTFPKTDASLWFGIADIVGDNQQGTPVLIFFYPRALVRKRQYQPGFRVERHDSNSIRRSQLFECSVTCRGDLIHFRPHAPAYVNQQHEIKRLFVGGESDDGLVVIVFEYPEIGFAQAWYGTAICINCFNIEMDERDTRVEACDVLSKERKS
jgi:hypothetical protein